MAVFPEQMDRLNLSDTTGSLQRIETYIRYMTERMEFANSRTTRTVSEAGVSTVGVYQALITLTDTVAVLQASVTGLSGKLTQMKGQIQTVDTALERLEPALSALEERVAGLDTNLTQMKGQIQTVDTAVNRIEPALDALQARVTALEGAGA